MMMKTTLGVALCVASSVTFAAAACAGATTAGSGTAITGATTNFVKVTFTPKCSANTYVDYEQDLVNLGAAGGSSKGKTVFAGNTSGGGVQPNGTTCASGCSATQSAAGATAALTAAGSS